MSETKIIGPVQITEDYVTACAQCKIALMRREVIFLLESPDPDEPDAYVHQACALDYLRASEDHP